MRIEARAGRLPCIAGRPPSPADDAAREHVDHEHVVLHPAPRRDVAEVRHPELIGPLGPKRALDRIARAGGQAIRDRRLHAAAPHHVPQAVGAPQSLDRTPRDRDRLAAELLSDLPRAVHAAIGAPHRADPFA